MRIWDINPKYLCREHLLGEHRELHAVWSILTKNKKGYRNHPEVLRWRDKLPALYKRHEKEVKEMMARGYNHYSPLSKEKGSFIQKQFINSIKEQKEILKNKKCNCKI